MTSLFMTMVQLFDNMGLQMVSNISVGANTLDLGARFGQLFKASLELHHITFFDTADADANTDCLKCKVMYVWLYGSIDNNY